MNSKNFLLIGGIILIALSILGFVGLIGPTAEQSIFGGYWWFDNTESWAYLAIGIIAVILAYVVSENAQKVITVAMGAVGVLVGLYSIAGSATLMGANLENPLDTIFNLAIGIWAIWAGFSTAKSESRSQVFMHPIMR